MSKTTITLLTDQEYRQQSLIAEIAYANKKVKACHAAVRSLQRRGEASVDWAIQNVNLTNRAAATIETTLERDADTLTEELVESATHAAAVARAASAELRRQAKLTMARAEKVKADLA